MSFTVILGFDFGLRRIGVAVGQAITQSANPLSPLIADRGTPHWPAVAQLISTWNPQALLVGLPFQMDGREQAISFAARQFAHLLKEKFNLPVFLVDERLTTREAKRQLKESGTADISIDSYAAKLILEQWMAENR